MVSWQQVLNFSLISEIIHAIKFQENFQKTINKQEILILFSLFLICKIIHFWKKMLLLLAIIIRNTVLQEEHYESICSWVPLQNFETLVFICVTEIHGFTHKMEKRRPPTPFVFSRRLLQQTFVIFSYILEDSSRICIPISTQQNTISWHSVFKEAKQLY